MIKTRLTFTILGALSTALIFGGFNNCSSRSPDLDSMSKSSSSTTPPPGPVPVTPTPTPPVVPNESIVPAGAVMSFAVSSCPTGWLQADGGTVLRDTYSHLFTAIGVTYGDGDGTTTFKLPDLRGYFLRGASLGQAGRDPDVATRTNRGDGTVGDNVGTKQSHAVGSHRHHIAGGIMYGANPGGGDTVGGASRVGSGNTELAGAGETRPMNISVLYCISTGGQ